MKPVKFIAVILLGVLLSSCYHAQIITDAQPSGETIDNAWAHGFIFGLVPPKEVRTANTCPNGVAKVDTQISFFNGLVSAITLNIYTPMHITVSCAEGAGTAANDADFDEELMVEKVRVKQASEKSIGSQKLGNNEFKKGWE